MDIAYELPVEGKPAPSALPFVREVAELYHRNAWLFLKIMLPAACFGWLVLTLSWQQAAEIQRTLPRGPAIAQHQRELLEIGLFRWFGFAMDWVMYCFACAATCIAVDRIEQDEAASAESSYAPVRERIGAFVKLTLALGLCVFVFFLSAIACLVGIEMTWHRQAALLDRNQIAVLTALVGGMCFWGAARFGLAMPCVLLNGDGIRKAFLRSWRLTTGCWSILGLLLLESVGGSLIAYKIPLWIWRVSFAHRLTSTWMWWVASFVGFVLGLLLQPHMPVGFALLYLRRSNGERE